MSNRVLVAVSLMALLPFAAAAQAPQEFYVSSVSGQDTNAGTSVQTPFKTLKAAVQRASGGSVITLLPGVYDGGVTLKAGVPIESRFGGVLEVKDANPRRFTAIINYGGTSIDPSEQYIRAKMTSVRDTAKTGNGRILANFREIPAQSRSIVENCVKALKDAGIGGVYVLGNTSEPVCQIAVGPNRVGMVLLGGLNPVAAAVEAGIEVENISESGMIDFQELRSFRQL